MRMYFDSTTGSLFLSENFSITHGIRRANLITSKIAWEPWIENQGQVMAYRAVLSDVGKDGARFLIVDFQPNDGVVSSWSISPTNTLSGAQNRPEGKYTQRARGWFQSVFATKLPLIAVWGEIDATYDPHNSEAFVFCQYKL
jgi:hypothetical protein